MRSRKYLLVMAMAGLLMACSESQGKDKSIELGPISKVTEPTSTVMPIAQFLPSQETLRKIQQAETVKMHECMARFGYKADIEAPTDKSIFDDIRKGTRLPISLEQARKFGYSGTGSEVSDNEKSRRQNSSDEEKNQKRQRFIILNGFVPDPPQGGNEGRSGSLSENEGPVKVDGKAVPEGGCIGWAAGEVSKGAPDLTESGGRDRSALNSILAIRYKALIESAEHPRYKSMLKEWSNCMNRAGFAYSDFDAAAEDAEWSRSGDITEQEIAVATTDVKCRLRVNYLGISEAVHVAYEKRTVVENAGTLALVEKYYKVLLRNAESVL